jgi:hypothetical protein
LCSYDPQPFETRGSPEPVSLTFCGTAVFFTPVSNVPLINTSAFYIYNNHDFLLVDSFIPFAVWGF